MRFTESQRMRDIQAPVIPYVAELIGQNPGTISLGQGIVNYPPPESAFDEIQAFQADPDNHIYGPSQGLSALCELLREKLARENQINTSPAYELMVTAGANMAFLNALLAITDPGDEVILNVPYYFNHEMAVRMLSCRPVLVSTDHNQQLNLAAIESAITERTRAVVTVSPNNPTGVIYPRQALTELNELCRTHGIYHISDEAYEYFIYDEFEHFSPASLSTAQAHTISLYSLSKSYGFAGWRIGYMLIPAHLSMAALKAQDTNLICPPLISQHAAIGALKTGSRYCRAHLQKLDETRRIVLDELNSLGDLCTIPPTEGAFYVFLKVNTELSDRELVERLIIEHKVAVIPGSTFGQEQGCYLRVAYAALEKETAQEGIQRLVNGLRAIIQ